MHMERGENVLLVAERAIVVRGWVNGMSLKIRAEIEVELDSELKLFAHSSDKTRDFGQRILLCWLLDEQVSN